MVSGQENTASGKVSSDLPVTRLDNITALAYTRATGGAAPLKGKVLRYEKPTEPVVQESWDSEPY